LLRYFTWRMMIAVQCASLYPKMAADLVLLRSMVIVSGTLWRRSALMRKCWAVCWSQREVSRESMMWPCFSTAPVDTAIAQVHGCCRFHPGAS
jgi:hypothetical protein